MNRTRRLQALRASARSRRGMSLVEIMVVIAIILTLMSIIGYGVIGVFEDSKIETTKISMGNIAQKVSIYSVRKSKPPTMSEGLKAAFSGEDVPKDAWGKDFVYVTPGPDGADFDILSLGKDGAEGGTGRGADIKLSEIGK